MPPKHDAGTATRHYRAFWQRRCRAAAAGAVLKPQGGNCAVLPLLFCIILHYIHCCGGMQGVFSPTVDCYHARHGADSAWFTLIFYCVYIIIKLFYCLIVSLYQLSNFISLPQRMCYYWQKIQLYQNLSAMGGCSSVVPCWGYWCLCWCSGSAHWM